MLQAPSRARPASPDLCTFTWARPPAPAQVASANHSSQRRQAVCPQSSATAGVIGLHPTLDAPNPSCSILLGHSLHPLCSPDYVCIATATTVEPRRSLLTTAK